MTQHTPTPWHITDIDEETPKIMRFFVYGEDNYMVADCSRIQRRTTEEGSANAAFIVRACNSHDALVDVLKNAVSDMEGLEGVSWRDNLIDWHYDFLEKAKAALALAKGE